MMMILLTLSNKRSHKTYTRGDKMRMMMMLMMMMMMMIKRHAKLTRKVTKKQTADKSRLKTNSTKVMMF